MNSPTNDRLDRLAARQQFLMAAVGLPIREAHHESAAALLDDPIVKDVLIMIASEVQEALEPLTLRSKPWKTGVHKEQLAEDFYGEAVDIVFLFLELLSVLGISMEELETRYVEKWRYNLIKRLGIGSVLVDELESTLNKPAEPQPLWEGDVAVGLDSDGDRMLYFCLDPLTGLEMHKTYRATVRKVTE